MNVPQYEMIGNTPGNVKHLSSPMNYFVLVFR